VALAADHAGVALKRDVKTLLTDLHADVQDFGTDNDASVDYPDFAERAARAVVSGAADVGILICGTGIGMAMAANKIAGVRAAPVNDVETARLSREHNDANVLAIGARTTPIDRAIAIVRVFLETAFAGGRHQGRLDKIAALESARAGHRPHARAASSENPS
jgi:ribose 5-phosphate isomerase B